MTDDFKRFLSVLAFLLIALLAVVLYIPSLGRSMDWCDRVLRPINRWSGFLEYSEPNFD